MRNKFDENFSYFKRTIEGKIKSKKRYENSVINCASSKLRRL